MDFFVNGQIYLHRDLLPSTVTTLFRWQHRLWLSVLVWYEMVNSGFLASLWVKNSQQFTRKFKQKTDKHFLISSSRDSKNRLMSFRLHLLTFLRLMTPSLVSLSVDMENMLAPSELMMLYLMSALTPRSSSLALIFPTGFPTWADSGTYSW